MSPRVPAEIEQALIDALEFVEGYVDVVDGDYGEPAPNKAMRLHRQLTAALSAVDNAEAA